MKVNSNLRAVVLLCLLALSLLALPHGTAAQGAGVIEGQVTLRGEETLPEGLEIELLFLPNGQGPPRITKEPLGPDGQYRFTDLDTSPQHRYLVRVKYQGEDNMSDVLAFNEGETVKQVELHLLERTTDSSALSLPEVRYILDAGPEGWIVAVLYRFHNGGDQTIKNEMNPPARIPLPADATNVRFTDEVDRQGIVELADGFGYTGPFQPGDTPLVFVYILPYNEGEQSLTLPVGLAAARAQVLVAQLGQRTETRDLEAVGVQEAFSGRPFELYEATELSEGQSFTFHFTNLPPKPEASAPPESGGGMVAQPRVLPLGPLDRLPWWAPLVPVGLVLAGLAAYLKARPSPSKVERRAALRERRDALIAEIAALDMRYEGGAIGQQSHTRQRDALKRELKEVLRRLGSPSSPARGD